MNQYTDGFEADALPMPPSLERTGEIFTLRWHDRNVEMIVERFDTDRHHNVTAEITVQLLNSESGSGHITRGRAGLLSTFRTMIDDATDFGGERNDKDAWRVMFKQMSNAVVDRYREGEPLINLAEMKREGPKPFLLSPFIFEGSPSVIYGRGGVGKSLFCLYLAVLLNQGATQNRLKAQKKCNVIYLDYEADAEESKHRADLIAHGLGMSQGIDIYYRHCAGTLASEIDIIQKRVNEVDADIVVIDSAIPACGNALDPDITGKFFAALRSLNTGNRKVASLIIGHTTKAQDNSGGPFGSVQWRNQPRTVWEFRADQQAGNDEIDVQLIHQKVNLGKLLAPIGFKIRWAQGAVEIDSLDTRRHETFGADAPLGDRIAACIEQYGRLSFAELLRLISNVDPNVDEDELLGILDRDNRFTSLDGGIDLTTI